MFRFISAFLLTLTSAASLFGQPAQSIETRTFQALPGESIVVQNDYGRVRVSAWQEPFIEVRIRTIAADASELAAVSVVAEKRDGKIFVQAMEQVIRIRTGETGEDAI